MTDKSKIIGCEKIVGGTSTFPVNFQFAAGVPGAFATGGAQHREPDQATAAAAERTRWGKDVTFFLGRADALKKKHMWRSLTKAKG